MRMASSPAGRGDGRVIHSLRYVVGDADSPSLVALSPRLGVGLFEAIEEGRVFVGRARATPETLLRVGDVVVVHPPRSGLDVLVVLHSDPELVVVDKPASLPTIGDHRGVRSLASLVTARFGGEVHPTSRLDVGVSGVVVFARTRRARAGLAAARERGAYDRSYVALARGSSAELPASWDEPIGRADDPRRRRVGGQDAAPARTEARLLASRGDYALLSLRPITGRTHQLRVHAAHHGLPLVGDRVYGGAVRVVDVGGGAFAAERVMLHARRVEVAGRAFVSPVPAALREVWRRVGGDDSAWEALG